MAGRMQQFFVCLKIPQILIGREEIAKSEIIKKLFCVFFVFVFFVPLAILWLHHYLSRKKGAICLDSPFRVLK